MVNSIKTEIIYYGLPTDFEFEFNLCGCCQMRLLTDVVNDDTALLKALQRSITRSRVIIIVGKVTGEANTISLISKVIGYDCEEINTDIFEVKSDEKITLIKNSVPLITNGGIFGGCIIESGPQSMIFLSDDKKVRKEIMNSLVHPYLADLSKYPVQAANSEPSDSIKETTQEFLEEIAEEIVPDEELTAADEIDDEIVEEETQEQEVPTEFEDFPTFSDTAPAEPEDDPYNIDNFPSSIEIDDIADYNADSTDDDTYFSSHREKSSGKGLNIASLVLSIILLVLLAFIVYAFIYLPLNSGISITENFSNVFSFLTVK